MPDPTPDQRIDADRREKWVEYRRKHGMPDDAPFVGKCPWEETYEEMLDALNYLEQIPKPEGFRELLGLNIAISNIRQVSRICLRNMKGGTE
jgi:hypothetical protein